MTIKSSVKKVSPASDAMDFVRKEFVRRQDRSSGYSLRAFARDLGVSAPHLSRCLDSSRRLSIDTATKIAAALRMKVSDHERFLTLVELSETRSTARRDLLTRVRATQDAAAAYSDLEPGQFTLLGRWYYSAICQILPLLRGAPTPAKIARRLKISTLEASVALEKMLGAGILRKTRTGLEQIESKLATGGFPSATIRNWHRQWLIRATDALETTKWEERSFSGTTLRVDLKRVNEARELITEFRRRFAELVAGPETDAVFHLAVQFWRVDSDPDLSEDVGTETAAHVAAVTHPKG